MKMPKSDNWKAFTLVELMVAIGIIGLLSVISVPAYHKFKGRAKKAVCLTKMRSIHGALASALTDNGEWPQMPTDDDGNLEIKKQPEYFKFWRNTLSPYGLSAESWVCPADASSVDSLTEGPDEYIGSYVPTWFGPGGNTPFRWNQPWLVERSGFHGKGHHVAMPDGSITESANPFGGR